MNFCTLQIVVTTGLQSIKDDTGIIYLRDGDRVTQGTTILGMVLTPDGIRIAVRLETEQERISRLGMDGAIPLDLGTTINIMDQPSNPTTTATRAATMAVAKQYRKGVT